MKKVLLTKSQHIQAVATADLSSKQPAAPVRVIAKPMAAQLSTATYIQRKSFQTIYEDIFKLLMRIPDKALQQRVIDAINGRNSAADKVTISHQGKQCSCEAKKVDAFTQTEAETDFRDATSGTIKNMALKCEENPAIKHESVDHKAAGTSSEPSPISTPIASPNQPVKVAKKRGRKRNTCVPKVVKRSAAEMALQEREEKQLTPVVTKRRKQEVSTSASVPKPTQERRESSCSDLSIQLDLHDITRVQDYINDGTDSRHIRHKIVQIMADEFRKVKMSEEGLLPIHDYILRNDIYGVKRQIFVCSHAKLDINELLTEDGEDCLQLALTNETDPEITSLILGAGCLTDHVYENSNTALHLAVINNINVESIKILMRSIDLNLLLETNDDGYTVLHLAVRQNQFLIAEAIFDIIDQRDLGEAVYQRAIEVPAGCDERDEKVFAKYYDRACDSLHANKHKLKNRRLKMNVINATEARAGNTPLFYAVECEQEHFCYFLLAHLADPDEENLSGYSPKSFHYEYARILRINLRVSRVMDKVTAILNS